MYGEGFPIGNFLKKEVVFFFYGGMILRVRKQEARTANSTGRAGQNDTPKERKCRHFASSH